MAVIKNIGDAKTFHITYNIEVTESNVNNESQYRSNKTKSIKGNLEGSTSDVIKEIKKFLDTLK